jgi:hypothetical protein
MILTFFVLLLLLTGLTVRPDTSIIYSCVGLAIIFILLVFGLILLLTAFFPKKIYVECDTPEP